MKVNPNSLGKLHDVAPQPPNQKNMTEVTNPMYQGADEAREEGAMHQLSKNHDVAPITDTFAFRHTTNIVNITLHNQNEEITNLGHRRIA